MPGFMFVAGYFSAREIRTLRVADHRILRSAQSYSLPFFSWFLLVTCLLLGGYGRNPVTAAGVLITNTDVGLWFLWAVFVLSVIITLCNVAVSRGASLVG